MGTVSADEVIRATLVERELEFTRSAEGAYLVSLPGTHRLATPCWLIAGDHSLLVDSRSPADFAAAIDRVVTAPALRAELSAGARRHAERFSWERTAEGLLAAYRGALGAATPLATAVGGS